MNFEQLKGEAIFAGKLYKIPEYQRYYEWEEKESEGQIGQINQFWEDLKSYIDSTNPFPLGVFILQENGSTYEVVDGQQRLTTLVILLRALIDTLKERNRNFTEWELFLINPYKGKPILEIQPQDNLFFQNCIIKGEDCQNPSTLSQRRIKEAKDFFLRKLKSLEDEKLEKLQELIRKRIFVFVIKVLDKKEASYMFELHNSRGKPLSNLDKLKSFILHRLYVKNAPRRVIDYVYNTFGEIYRIEFEILQALEEKGITTRLTEEDILTAFGNLIFSYEYNFEKLKKSLKEKNAEELEGFVSNLYRSFKAVKNFIKDDSDYANYIKDYLPLKFNFILPFLVRIYGTEFQNREKFLKIFEKLLFVHNLAYTNARIEYRIKTFLENFNIFSNPEEFEKKVFETLHKEGYWNERRLLENLKGYMYNALARIILKRYEISLSIYEYNVISKGEYIHKEPWQLEHIAPQNLKNKEISGYRKCEDFEEKYLNSLGNLLLVSKWHNIALGDKPSAEKLNSYKNESPFQHHKEVEQFSENGIWSCGSIEQRLKRLEDFVKTEWRL